MPSFDDKSFKKATLKPASTREFSTLDYFKSNSYLSSTSVCNVTTSEDLSTTTYEAHVP